MVGHGYRGGVNSGARQNGVDPFGLAALAGAGTLGAHELGYLAGSDDGSVSHAHFAVLGPLALFAVCAAGWFAAVRVLRDGGGHPPSMRSLVGLQTALYLVIEVGERVAVGDLESLASAPVALGLILQPVIAWAAIQLLRLGSALLLAAFGRPRRRFAAPPAAWFAPTLVHVPAVIGRHERVRGPPVR